jgi:hypothetical protein
MNALSRGHAPLLLEAPKGSNRFINIAGCIAYLRSISRLLLRFAPRPLMPRLVFETCSNLVWEQWSVTLYPAVSLGWMFLNRSFSHSLNLKLKLFRWQGHSSRYVLLKGLASVQCVSSFVDLVPEDLPFGKIYAWKNRRWASCAGANGKGSYLKPGTG